MERIYLTSNTKITIGFRNSNVYGNAGINIYFTSYSIRNNKIILVAALMSRNEEDIKNEEAFLSDLLKVNSVSLNNNELTIKTYKNKELVFKEIALTIILYA